MQDKYTHVKNIESETTNTNTLKYTEREMIEALQVIRNVCNDHPYVCIHCPFSGKDGNVCIIGHVAPHRWKIKEITEEKLLLN